MSENNNTTAPTSQPKIFSAASLDQDLFRGDLEEKVLAAKSACSLSNVLRAKLALRFKKVGDYSRICDAEGKLVDHAGEMMAVMACNYMLEQTRCLIGMAKDLRLSGVPGEPTDWKFLLLVGPALVSAYNAKYEMDRERCRKKTTLDYQNNRAVVDRVKHAMRTVIPRATKQAMEDDLIRTGDECVLGPRFEGDMEALRRVSINALMVWINFFKHMALAASSVMQKAREMDNEFTAREEERNPEFKQSREEHTGWAPIPCIDTATVEAESFLTPILRWSKESLKNSHVWQERIMEKETHDVAGFGAVLNGPLYQVMVDKTPSKFDEAKLFYIMAEAERAIRSGLAPVKRARTDADAAGFDMAPLYQYASDQLLQGVCWCDVLDRARGVGVVEVPKLALL